MSPSCKEVSELVSQSLDRKLSLSERLRMRLHLMMCRMCTNYQRQLQFVRHAVRQLDQHAPPTPLPDDAKERIKKRIEQSAP